MLLKISRSWRTRVSFAKIYQIKRYLSMDDRNSINIAAVCQMTSTSAKDENLKTCERLVKRGADMGAKIVFLPEACDYLAENKEKVVLMAEPMSGPTVAAYTRLAQQNQVWLSIGGVHIKDETSQENDKVYNRHIMIDPKGRIVAYYDKIHLFDVAIEGQREMKESSYVCHGNRIVPPVETAVGKVGLGVCYDLRFPEFSLSLAKQGADILTYPSAFTLKTGLAHWEPLLRARAIETQCYVVAAAQTGNPFPNRQCFGHAMIVDPWGQVVCCCHEGTDVSVANIDLKYLQNIRKQMPVWSHRKVDVYANS